VSKSQSRTLVRVLKRRGSGVPAPIVLDLHGRLAGRNATADERRWTLIQASSSKGNNVQKETLRAEP
jgi:hypothetical protein